MFHFPNALSFLLLWIFIASDNLVDSHLSIFIQGSCTYQKKLQERISAFEKVIKMVVCFGFLFCFVFKYCFIFTLEFQSFSEFPGNPLVKSHQSVVIKLSWIKSVDGWATLEGIQIFINFVN